MIRDFDSGYMDFNVQRDYPAAAQDEPSMDGVQLAAGPSPVVSDAGAAFGVYPGMGKRSQKSNIGEKMITGAPDFGAGALREGTAAALGFGGDMQKIGRFIGALATDNQGGTFMDKVNRAGKTMQDPTFLPSSEEVSKEGFTIPGTDITIQLPPAVPPGTSALGLTPEERQAAAEAGGTVGELVGDPFLLAKGGTMAVKGAMAAGKALAPEASRMAIKSMEMLGTPVQMNIVPPSPSTASAATKAMAPASNIGFYSAVEKAALNVQRNSGSGQAFLNDITKGENVKLDEIKWMGLDDFLKGKKNVTKQEVQDFVTGNRLDVKEIGLSDTALKKKFSVNSPEDQDFYDVVDKNNNVVFTGKEDDADYFIDRSQPKFGSYTLPGGENYREILLTLPNQWDKPRAAQIANEAKIKALRQEMYGTSGTNEIRSEISRLQNENTALQKQISEAPIYKSSHFDQPNILAHMRVNDRVDAEGKKMLLIEEVQSDWHQAGREQGYIDPNKKPYTVEQDQNGVYRVRDQSGQRFDPYVDGQQMSGFMTAEAAENAMKGNMGRIPKPTGVPDAPFKDTWYQLALKRALRYAADNGYDRVGLTTGKQQAERYDLAKQINELSYKKMEDDLTLSLGDGPYYEVSAIDKNNSPVLKKQVTEKELPNLVGKEMAKKIINGEGSGYPDGSISSGSKVFTGIDLQVGGEGMKKYYDDVYPKFLEKYGKKWGASVGDTSIETNRSRDADGIPSMRKNKEPVRYIDITPEMRKSVQKGQPLAAVSGEETVA